MISRWVKEYSERGEKAFSSKKKGNAYSAIDAVSHCVEGYIGGGHSKKTDKMSIDGIRYVFENIQKVVDNGKDI